MKRLGIKNILYLGGFYGSPVVIFALSAYILSDEEFVRFNFIFLSAGLITFLVDFGDEIHIPKREMMDAIGRLELRRILLRRSKRAAIFSIILVCLTLGFGEPIDMIWAFYPFGGAITLAFWHKAKGSMARLIEVSLPVRLVCALSLPIYAQSIVGVHLACFVFYFAPSLFLLLFDRPYRLTSELVANEVSMQRIGTREGIAGFVVLACNLLTGWLPFFLSEQRLLSMSSLALILVRSAGFISQFMGILTSLMHRRLWEYSVSLTNERRRFVSNVTFGISLPIMLMSVANLFFLVSEEGDQIAYLVVRLSFFFLVFIIMIHFTETFWLSLASSLPVIAWLLTVLLKEQASPFTSVNLAYAIALTLLAFNLRARNK